MIKKLIFALVVFLVLTQFTIFVIDRELWFDPAFSIQTVHIQLEAWLHEGAIDYSEWDVHPPVYYDVLTWWMILKPDFIRESIWAVQLSVLFGLVFLVFAFFAMRQFFGDVGEWAVVIIAFLTPYIHYATEARMYIMVLALSAMVIWAIANEFRRWWHLAAAIVGIMLLPLVHYISAIAIPVYLVIHYVWYSGSSIRKKFFASVMFSVSVVSVAYAVNLALQQASRTAGTWLQAPNLGGFLSASFFSFFMTQGTAQPLCVLNAVCPYASEFIQLMYFFFMIAFLLFGWWLFNTISKDMSRQVKIQVVFGCTVFLSLGFILMLNLIGLFVSSDFVNLYHHRFFLVVSWLFVVSMIVWALNYLKSKSLWWDESRGRGSNFLYLFGVGWFIFMGICMFFVYADSSQYELKNMIHATPCSDEHILIGHESPFSSLPYEVYGREFNCNWSHFVSTDMSLSRSRAAGFDALVYQTTYWNSTLPEQEFYYVQSLSKSFNLSGRQSYIVDSDEGIWLLFVFQKK